MAQTTISPKDNKQRVKGVESPDENGNKIAASLEPQELGSTDTLFAVFGYESQLVRTRSTIQVAFMSFVLAAVPYGLSTTLLYPLAGGGPVAVIWGFCGVCVVILCLAVSLGEITSLYPTAGGVYYQTYMLSPIPVRRVTAWICGWTYAMGNVIIVLAVNFGTSLFVVGCINIFHDEEGHGVFPAKTYQTYLIFLMITLITNAMAAFGNKWLPLLDTTAICWTFLSVFATMIAVLVMAKEGRNSARFVFTSFTASTGWPDGWSFCIGLLHGVYVTSATGMVVSMCEEVHKPETQVPNAMCGGLFLNWLCGLLFMVPLLFVMPSITDILSDPFGQPVPFILRAAIGNETGAFILTIPLILLALVCGTACVTASSRFIWAFARDGALPFSETLEKVSPTQKVPVNAIIFGMVIQLLVGLIYFGSYAAFNAFTGSGVILLSIAYVMPVIMSLFGNRKQIAGSSWNFGKLGVLCNFIIIGWTIFITPLFSFPFFNPTTPNTMNYASAVFLGGVVISAVCYFTWGKTHYKGPPA